MPPKWSHQKVLAMLHLFHSENDKFIEYGDLWLAKAFILWFPEFLLKLNSFHKDFVHSKWFSVRPQFFGNPEKFKVKFHPSLKWLWKTMLFGELWLFWTGSARPMKFVLQGHKRDGNGCTPKTGYKIDEQIMTIRRYFQCGMYSKWQLFEIKIQHSIQKFFFRFTFNQINFSFILCRIKSSHLNNRNINQWRYKFVKLWSLNKMTSITNNVLAFEMYHNSHE